MSSLQVKCTNAFFFFTLPPIIKRYIVSEDGVFTVVIYCKNSKIFKKEYILYIQFRIIKNRRKCRNFTNLCNVKSKWQKLKLKRIYYFVIDNYILSSIRWCKNYWIWLKREMQSWHKRPDNAELAIEIRNINRSHSLLAESNFITFISLLRKWHCLHIVFFMQITLLRFFLLLIVKNLIQC